MQACTWTSQNYSSTDSALGADKAIPLCSALLLSRETAAFDHMHWDRRPADSAFRPPLPNNSASKKHGWK